MSKGSWAENRERMYIYPLGGKIEKDVLLDTYPEFLDQKYEICVQKDVLLDTYPFRFYLPKDNILFRFSAQVLLCL